MFRLRKHIALAVLTASTTFAALASTAAADNGDRPHDRVGTVYTLTNSPNGNEVLAFDRAADGTLTSQGAYATNGIGTGAGLGSQGALALADDHLFAVNASSNSISEFKVRDHRLSLEATVASGGVTPISVTVHDHVLYVLNAGDIPNITGFFVAPHNLFPIASSTRSLSAGAAGPAQVSFSPAGDVLVVTEKGSSTIDTFRVGRKGLAGTAVASPSTGAVPFGFDFDSHGHVLVSNASGSASSYSVGRLGELSVISGAVPTGNAAPCWLVVTPNGRFAYTANAGAGTISGFSVARNGSLALLASDGVSASFGAGSHPLDEIVTGDGEFFYNLTDGLHVINGFHIASDGSLTLVATSSPLPVGAVGIVAN